MENSATLANSCQKPIPTANKKVAFVSDEKLSTSVASKQSGATARLSLSLRGKRKSSFANVQSSIHPEIAPSDFHKHVNSSLPDPLRLRQVIVYAVSHHLSRNKVSDVAVTNALNNLIQLILKKQVSTSWFSRPRNANEGLVISLPNPANRELQSRISGYREVLARLAKDNAEILEYLNDDSKSSNVSKLFQSQDTRKGLELLEIDPSSQELKIHVSQMTTYVKQADKYLKFKTKSLNASFMKIIDACWDSGVDFSKPEMEPFAKKYAKAGRRLSFNLKKADECAKILRVLSSN